MFHKGGPLSQTPAICHEIKLENPKPFREAPRRFSDVKKQFIDEQKQEILADGIIEPANSPWSSAIVVANKQGREYRFCIDYRRLNAQTVAAPQCLPRIHEILKDVGKAKFFTTLDLKSGYWQVPMSPYSQKYTAFSTPTAASINFGPCRSD